MQVLSNRRVYMLVMFVLIAALAAPSAGMLFKKEISSYPIKAEVISYANDSATPIGVSGDSDTINFGRLPILSNSTKFMEFENTNNVETKTIVAITGNAAKHISAPDSIVLKPGEKAKISLKFRTEETGNFTGALILTSYIPRHPSGNWLFMFL